MARHLLLAAAGIALLLILQWTEKAHHPLPKWVWALMIIPYFWMASRDADDESIFGDSHVGPGIVLLIGGIVAIIAGSVSIALKGSGSLLEIFGFMLPAGVLMVLGGLLKLFFGGPK